MWGADRISGLPSSVLDHILTFLPLREAVRTSVLSREWRNRWVNMPALVIDDKFGKVVRPVAAAGSPDIAAAANYKLMLDILNVLMHHRGRLKEFSFLIPELRSSFPDHRIDQIIDFLNIKHIESLAIEITDYVLPRRIYSFTRLKKLKLCGCKFTSSNVEFDSASFAGLDVLELIGLAVPQVDEACFSFNCLLLSALTMEGCGHHTSKISIVIEAPKLEYFRLLGSFSFLEFKHTPLLKTVDVHRDSSINIVAKGYSNFLNFAVGLPAVERLSVSGSFYDYLTIGAEHAIKSCSRWCTLNLKHLRLDDLCLGSTLTAYLWSGFGLMNSSAGLTELIINIGKPHKSGNVEQGLKYINNYNSRKLRPKLKLVKVNQFDGTRLEMALVRSFLATSPALDKMEIEFSAGIGVEDRWLICQELLEFTRASPTARITIK
ncbi:unnamed protein product [Linum tenue]|uniref:F-box domain-containing protein n=1 Tax=Linum tenue TaxID=586396 RepID=A0AAV0GSM1_9ROSI|nr:unnamed protein product [Linum tenue]